MKTACLPWACFTTFLQDMGQRSELSYRPARSAIALGQPWSTAARRAMGHGPPCSGLCREGCCRRAGVPALLRQVLPFPWLRGEQQLDGEDAALGKAALPVIALESLGILPH